MLGLLDRLSFFLLLVFLFLSRNALHGFPPNMDVTLPCLSKLELYGNSIDWIKRPEASLNGGA